MSKGSDKPVCCLYFGYEHVQQGQANGKSAGANPSASSIASLR
jgi:hypothetical protein